MGTITMPKRQPSLVLRMVVSRSYSFQAWTNSCGIIGMLVRFADVEEQVHGRRLGDDARKLPAAVRDHGQEFVAVAVKQLPIQNKFDEIAEWFGVIHVRDQHEAAGRE